MDNVNVKQLVLLLALAAGCGEGAMTSPTHITIIPDAAVQTDPALIQRVRAAASLWSTVGADVEVRLSGDGLPLRLVSAAAWDHAPSSVGAEGVGACADGPCIEVQREALAALLPGEQEVALAHELGHALGLWHVDDQYAVMYRYVNHPLAAEGLREADAAEYFAVHSNE